MSADVRFDSELSTYSLPWYRPAESETKRSRERRLHHTILIREVCDIAESCRCSLGVTFNSFATEKR